MVAGNNNFMLVRQGIEEGYKAIELSPIAILSEIPSMYKDISRGQFSDIEMFVEVMSITHGQYPYSLLSLHTNFNISCK